MCYFSAENSSELFDYHHSYTNVTGLFSFEQPADPFDTSIFDTAAGPIHSSSSTTNIPNSLTTTNESVEPSFAKLDMSFINELEKTLGNKEARANTNNKVVIAPPNVVPKKLNTENLNSAIPRPLSSTNVHTNDANSRYYSTTELDMSSFVSKYDSDPIYAANLNLAENKVKELCISNIPSNMKNMNNASSNYFRNDSYSSNVKTDNLTVASNYSSPYYSPPVNPSRYYSQTPNMYQIVPEPSTVIYKITIIIQFKLLYYVFLL